MKISDEFKKELNGKVADVEKIIMRYIPNVPGYQKTVAEAMRYSLLAGGKRLRPLIMQEVCRMMGGNLDEVCPYMAALEMIHTYSLIHDDLPAMDNDDYRRGKLTNHKVYGEAMAILAGDGLLNLAFETAAKAAADCPDERHTKALYILATRAGLFGMLGGQAAEIDSERRDPGRYPGKDLLGFIYEKKTGALIEAAFLVGGIIAGASESEQRNLSSVAMGVGMAFQIQDDILDIQGDSIKIGKPIGSDSKNRKRTYAAIYGLEESKKAVARYSEDAIKNLSALPGDKRFLTDLIYSLIQRDR